MVLTDDQQLAVASLAREGLIKYAIAVNDKYEPNWHHFEIAEKLEKAARGEIKRLMIFMPPRHGKSELASILFPSWYLGNNPDKNVIAISYGEDLSIKFGRQVRNLIMSDVYNYIFPECELSPDSKSANKFDTVDRGGYFATGVGGVLTGFGADLMIIDDPIKNREEADSDTVRQKIKDFYSSTARTRLEKGASLIVIQTRWHDDDLSGWLLEQSLNGEGEEWEVVSYPAVATHDEPYRDAGEPLWPERFDLDELNRIKRSVTDRDWNALYQQTPSGEGVQKFFREWFRYWDELPGQMTYLTVVDPAFKKKAGSDSSVVMTVGFSGSKVYILEYTKGKYELPALIDKIAYHAKKWNPVRVGVEAYAAQAGVAQRLREKFADDEIYIDVVDILQKGSKEQKIESISPKWREGKILHHPTMIDLEQQLLSFPTGKHDDVIDAVQMAVNFDMKDIPIVDKSSVTLDSWNYKLNFNEYGEPIY